MSAEELREQLTSAALKAAKEELYKEPENVEYHEITEMAKFVPTDINGMIHGQEVWYESGKHVYGPDTVVEEGGDRFIQNPQGVKFPVRAFSKCRFLVRIY
jgi:hypothetical protein